MGPPLSPNTSPTHSVCSLDVPEQHSCLLAQGSSDDEFDAKTEDTWVAVEDPPQGYPRLDFKPMVLRSSFLTFVLIFFLGCLTSVITLLYQSQKYGSVHSSSIPSHFAFRYLPTVIGTTTTMLWGSIRSNLNRMTPYMSMAGSGRTIRGHKWRETIGAAYFPKLNINLGAGHWLLLAVIIQQIVLVFVIPLKSVLFISQGDHVRGWETRVYSSVAYALIFIYASLICSTLALLRALWDRRTGLKWDPVSIADNLVLLRGSDILDDFDGLDTLDRKTMDSLGGQVSDGTNFERIKLVAMGQNSHHGANNLRRRTYQLGYWRKGDAICHGIRRGPNYCGGKISGLDNSERPTLTAVYAEYSKPFVVLLSIVVYGIAVLLILGFRLGHRTGGVQIFVPMSPSQGRLVFRALPTTLSGIFVQFWLNTDTFHRATQPFSGMQEGNPQPASETLLLDYLCCPPLVVSIKAAMNGHWKVAFFSSLSLSTNLLRIVLGALFTITGVENGVIATASMQNYYTVSVFILIYCIFIPFTLPSQKRMLPRSILSLGDLISFCYDSKLITSSNYESVFALDRPIDTRRHMESRLFLKEGKYEFRTYMTGSGWRAGFDLAREGA